MNAGAFSIQRLEGSRFGTVVLWVLNGCEEREGWGIRESIGRTRGNWSSLEGFPEPDRLKPGTGGTLVAWVLESALES
jgi:hypothetical protein